ncbi:hypothetical protein DZF91_35655 [Actinomadura logoneensis]|uniref:Uncharacterized protein n=1 Tax=Actinomadura logoneensis TaxID=2293572 RepID=A0A372JAT7_9ACTN|nr:hypothetical protein [Actinomadura logoneensis]RFU36914.1 hypothetical protein DZF91_35655 [Actinomadura logoneensis]
MSGANPDWRAELTRPDNPLPRRPGETPSGSGEHAGQGSGPGAGGPKPKGTSAYWHRLHYPVGVFLVAYGLASVVATALSWSDRRDQVASYLDAGVATTALVGVKGLELLLVAVTVAGLLRRRDVWFLPALAGWMAGFGVLSVLDVLRGKWGGLAEHVAYLLMFGVLLFVSYGLGVKARIGRGPGGPGEGGTLSRTQELALAALNRIPRPSPPSRPSGPQFGQSPTG